MFGCVTPNLSILLRNTSKAVLIELLISSCNSSFTSSFVLLKFIFSRSAFVPKISGSLSLIPLVPAAPSNSVKNKSK